MSEKKPKAPQEPINTTTKRWHTLIDSPVGRLYLAASTKALTGLWYKEQTHFPIPDELGEFIPDPSAIAANSEPAPAASILKHHSRTTRVFRRQTYNLHNPSSTRGNRLSAHGMEIFIFSPLRIHHDLRNHFACRGTRSTRAGGRTSCWAQ